jgi:hypothetical protein
MNYTVANDQGFFHVTYSEKGEEKRVPYTQEEIARLPKYMVSFCNTPRQGIMFTEQTMKALSKHK